MKSKNTAHLILQIFTMYLTISLLIPCGVAKAAVIIEANTATITGTAEQIEYVTGKSNSYLHRGARTCGWSSGKTHRSDGIYTDTHKANAMQINNSNYLLTPYLAVLEEKPATYTGLRILDSRTIPCYSGACSGDYIISATSDYTGYYTYYLLKPTEEITNYIFKNFVSSTTLHFNKPEREVIIDGGTYSGSPAVLAFSSTFSTNTSISSGDNLLTKLANSKISDSDKTYPASTFFLNSQNLIYNVITQTSISERSIVMILLKALLIITIIIVICKIISTVIDNLSIRSEWLKRCWRFYKQPEEIQGKDKAQGLKPWALRLALCHRHNFGRNTRKNQLNHSLLPRPP